jgi:hypothetical protein
MVELSETVKQFIRNGSRMPWHGVFGAVFGSELQGDYEAD